MRQCILYLPLRLPCRTLKKSISFPFVVQLRNNLNTIVSLSCIVYISKLGFIYYMLKRVLQTYFVFANHQHPRSLPHINTMIILINSIDYSKSSMIRHSKLLLQISFSYSISSEVKTTSTLHFILSIPYFVELGEQLYPSTTLSYVSYGAYSTIFLTSHFTCSLFSYRFIFFSSYFAFNHPILIATNIILMYFIFSAIFGF